MVVEDHQNNSNSVLVRVYVPNLSETCGCIIIWEHEQKIVLGSANHPCLLTGKENPWK